MNAVSTTQLTPLSFLERSARVFPTKPAVVYDTQSWTYAEFDTEIRRVSRALASSGVGRGDRVAYLMPNIPEMLVAHYAVPALGAVLVAINTRLSGDEIAYILEHSGASMIIADADYTDTVAAAVKQVPTVREVVIAVDEIARTSTDSADSYGFTDYRDLRDRDTGSSDRVVEIGEFDPISLNYTSGTTGRPKGVLYSHRGAYLNSFGEIVHSSFTPQTVYLWTLPMFHCNGWCTTWAITAIGGTHVCLREVRGDVIWREIRTRGITHLNGAPTVVTTILNTPGAGKLDDPLTITTAGAPPSPATIVEMEQMGFDIVHVYGLTETYGPYSVCQPQPGWSSIDSNTRARLQARQGVGMIQAERLRVVDDDMVDVPADGATMGEIVMRGNNVMLGYYNDADGTQKAFAGGWFHSGDLGVVHPDGYVELRDRAKDIVISGGENISTIEVEQALMSHPAVLETAVIGVPDDKWGERPRAYVVLKAGHDITGPELVDHVKVRIARYKAPREVVVIEALPKTSTGKIQKVVLRDDAWSEKTTRIQG
ncbi:fatty-acyl-CoA synthase [Williamsia muralis]|uniref:Fatty-acyl-CoA synthase n=1 Tax=Williamsia marianensis TaxID=85044 RepID=A0A495K852_WILMA|nr:long-chain-fatty-acid--CoA ligase [Williamsia muralis]RKR97467.1 fatty-acyl-CoA synthase [Williamsia muralis]